VKWGGIEAIPGIIAETPSITYLVTEHHLFRRKKGSNHEV